MAIVGLAAYGNGGLLTVPPAMTVFNSVANLKMVKMENEIWKGVFGFEGFYQVSDMGRVKRLKRNHSNNQYKTDRIMSPRTSNNGYKNISFTINRHVKSFSVHRLVALHFISNPDNKPQINHKNAIKTDNRVGNLEWCTAKENMTHAHANGLVKPNKSGASDYRSHQVIMIDLGGNEINEFGSLMEAQRKTGIRNGNISKVLTGRTNTAGGYKWKIKNKEHEHTL